jgi:hypothetical protein
LGLRLIVRSYGDASSFRRCFIVLLVQPPLQGVLIASRSSGVICRRGSCFIFCAIIFSMRFVLRFFFDFVVIDWLPVSALRKSAYEYPIP